MEIPEEDNSALAKRRAIQALMKDKSLTPAERNTRMQAIMKGNFIDPGPPASRENSSMQQSHLTASIQACDSLSSGSDSSSVSSSSSSYTGDEDSFHDSNLTGRSSNSGRSDPHTNKNFVRRGTNESISVGSASGSGTGSGTKYSQSSSKVDPRNETTEHTTLSASTYSMDDKEASKIELQKERQKKLLELSRNPDLSNSQRSAKMKEVMKTNVGANRRGSMKKSISINESILKPGQEDMEALLQPSQMSMRRLSSEQAQAVIGPIMKQLANDDAALVELDLERRRLGDEDVIPLFDAFGGNTHVTALNLRINRIGNEGCSALASAILDNVSLTFIDLSGNNIDCAGIEDLCKVIPYNKTLTQLNLADNKIGDIGASELAGALVDNTSLLHVNLNGNFIGDEGATDLFKVLATTNRSLQSLLLRLNNITDLGASALASALIENETLLSVDLGHNRIGNKGGGDLLKVLSCNETIEEMKLDGNKKLDEEIIAEIERELTYESSSEEEGSESGSEYSSEEDISKNGGVDNNKMTTSSISADYAMEEKMDSHSESESDSEEEEQSKDESKDASKVEKDSAPTGGEAMLVDMPDETNLALAKRKAVQAVMQDKSLSAVERNKKIQDIMAGRVELPKVLPKTPAAAAAAKLDATTPAPTKPAEQKTEVVSRPTGGEAMLVDMPDEDNLALAKRRAVQAIMQDKSLSAVERNKKIQDIMAGRVELPKVLPKSPTPQSLDTPGPAKSTEPASILQDQSTKEKTMAMASRQIITENSRTRRKAADSSVPTGRSLNQGHDFKRKASHDNGTPTAIAYEWKQKMMAVHPKSHDNLLDVLLAHKYRLSLKSAPTQSSFRVVAVVFFSRNKGGVHHEERFHVVGSNDEPNSVSGSICAERAALMQLRFVPDLEEITKVIITTDDVDAISPGMLCREFMASNKHMNETAPIILGRAVCRRCGLNLSGKTLGDSMGDFDPRNNRFQEAQRKIFDECGAKKGAKYPPPHDFIGSITSLRDLFPYPSLYSGLSADDALTYGQRYAATKPFPKQNPNEGLVGTAQLTSSIKSTRTESTVGSYRQECFDLSMISDAISEEDNLGTHSATVSPPRMTPKSKAKPPSASFTASLKTTVDFMRQIREDGGDNQDEAGLNEMTPAILDHLKSKLKISARLKPSQRREKLIRLATEVTALEIPHSRIHPIRYGAAVLFTDDTVAMASQKVALEYGCTLDAIGQLASVIDKKSLQVDDNTSPARPVLIVMCDQFGIAHAPFAQGRSFLTERGYGDCRVLVHQQRHGKKPNNEAEGDHADLRLVEISASDLAPSPPDMFGKVISKNHSQGLGLEF